MKQFLLFAIAFTLLTGCGSKETQSELAQNANPEEGAPEGNIRKNAMTIHGISFRTDDYQNWRAVYKDRTNDLEMLGIYQCMEEAELYVVFEVNDGHADAKRFLDSRNFKNMCRESGSKLHQVVYYNIEGEIKGDVVIPFALGINYTINDWEKWREGWQSTLTELTSNGLELVGTARDNTNDKLYATWFAVKDLESVQAYIEAYKSESSKIPELGVKSTNFSFWKTMDRRN